MAQTPKALFFDVFGTLVDWRTGIARESERILSPLGHALDWPAFADAWRGEYQPAMREVRSGRGPLSQLPGLPPRHPARTPPPLRLPPVGGGAPRAPHPPPPPLPARPAGAGA